MKSTAHRTVAATTAAESQPEARPGAVAGPMIDGLNGEELVARIQARLAADPVFRQSLRALVESWGCTLPAAADDGEAAICSQ